MSEVIDDLTFDDADIAGLVVSDGNYIEGWIMDLGVDCEFIGQGRFLVDGRQMHRGDLTDWLKKQKGYKP